MIRKYCRREISAILALIVLGVGIGLTGINNLKEPTPKEDPVIVPSFVKNIGQTDESIKYYHSGKKNALYFSNEGLLTRSLYKEDEEITEIAFMQSFVDGHTEEIIASNPTESKFNYFNNDGQHSNISSYNNLLYRNIYDGIDVKYSFLEDGKSLKYDVIVHPGSDPNDFKIIFDNSELSLQDQDLHITTKRETFVQKAPYTYQIINGDKTEVASAFKLDGNILSFDLEDYDPNFDLIIDPEFATLSSSSYLGDSGLDQIKDVAVNHTTTYLTGITQSSSFPMHGSIGYDRTYVGSSDTFVMKFSEDLQTLEASTFLNSSQSGEDEVATAITLNTDGTRVYVGGTTTGNFPVTDSNDPGYDESFNGGATDIFLVQLSSDLGTFINATYLGSSGDDYLTDMIVEPTGGYVTGVGYTDGTDFPTKVSEAAELAGHSPYQETNGGSNDAIVFQISSYLQTLVKSTYIGGSGSDVAYGVDTVDISEDDSYYIYVTGSASSGFPTVAGGYDTSHNGSTDLFLVKFQAGLGTPSLHGSTFFGGSSVDYGWSVEWDNAEQSVYVGGAANSATMPGTGYDQSNAGITDGLILKFDDDLTDISASTYLGGTGTDAVKDIDIYSTYIYVAGDTASSGFPTVSGDYEDTYQGAGDAFLSRLNMDLDTLDSSTFIGGSGQEQAFAIIADGRDVWVVGTTTSTDHPTTSAYDSTHAGSQDGFMLYIDKSTLPSNWSTADSDDVAGIALRDIDDITCQNITDLDKFAAAGFTSSQVPLLTSAAVACITDDQILRMTTSAGTAFTPSQMTSLHHTAFPGFSATKMAALPAENFANVSAAQVVNITFHNDTDAGANGLTAAQIGYLPSTSFGPTHGFHSGSIIRLSNSAVAAITNAQMAALNSDEIAAFTTTQIPNITTSAIAAWSSADLAEVPAASIPYITTAQLAAIPDASYAGITAAQVENLTTSAVAAFTAEQLGYMPLASIGPTNGFSSTQVPHFTNDLINAFTSSQVSQFQPATAGAFSVAQIGELSLSAFGGFTRAQIPSIDPTELNSFGYSPLRRLTPPAVSAVDKDFLYDYWSSWSTHLKPVQITAFHEDLRGKANLRDGSAASDKFSGSIGTGLSRYNFSNESVESGGNGTISARFEDFIIKDASGNPLAVITADSNNPITDDVDLHGSAITTVASTGDSQTAYASSFDGSIVYTTTKGTGTEVPSIKGLIIPISNSDTEVDIWYGAQEEADMAGTPDATYSIASIAAGNESDYDRDFYLMDSNFNKSTEGGYSGTPSYAVVFTENSGGQGGGGGGVPEFPDYLYLLTLAICGYFMLTESKKAYAYLMERLEKTKKAPVFSLFRQ